MEGSSSKHFLHYFLILLAIFNFIYPSLGSRQITPKITSTEFIKTSCSSTSYPRLCFTSLASHASLIQTSPKLLCHAALNVTLARAKSTSATVLKLSKVIPGMKPRDVEAMQDCLEELSDSVDELKRSIREMGRMKASNFQLLMSDIQTWVSAALTDETTCSDGFEKNTVNGKVVRRQIVKIAHMTSNALALINNYASLHG